MPRGPQPSLHKTMTGKVSISFLPKACLFGLLISLAWPAFLRAGPNPFNDGIERLKTRQYDAALKAFSKVLEIMPHDYEAYNHRGTAWFFKGELANALSDYSESIRLNDQYALAYSNRGAAAYQLGDYDMALADFNRALELEPNFAKVYNQLALMLVMCPDKGYRNPGRAVALAEKSVALVPSVPHYDGLAMACAAAGSLGRAVEIMEMLMVRAKKEVLPEMLAEFRARLEVYRQQADLGQAPVAAGKTPEIMVYSKARIDEISGLKTKAKPVPAVKRTAQTDPSAEAVRKSFSVQIGAFQEKEKAVELWRRTSGRGWAGYTSRSHIRGRGIFYRVFAGCFETQAAAKTFAAELKKEGYPPGFVVDKPFAVRCRVEGGKLKSVLALLSREGYLGCRVQKNDADGAFSRLTAGAFSTAADAGELVDLLHRKGLSPTVVRR